MAYTKQTWSTGNVVTAAKMNNIEQGIYDAHKSGGCLVLQFSSTSIGTVMSSNLEEVDIYPEANGVTWQDVLDAINSGKLVYSLVPKNVTGTQYYDVEFIDVLHIISQEDVLYTNYTHNCSNLYDGTKYYAIGANGVLANLNSDSEK